jgi:hypothetical protein
MFHITFDLLLSKYIQYDSNHIQTVTMDTIPWLKSIFEVKDFGQPHMDINYKIKKPT